MIVSNFVSVSYSKDSPRAPFKILGKVPWTWNIDDKDTRVDLTLEEAQDLYTSLGFMLKALKEPADGKS